MRLFGCTIAALAISFTGAAKGADAIKVGDKAPNFKLVGSDGKTYNLEDFKGKQAVVVAWFPKAFTGGCTKECKSMAQSSKELKATGIAYFTASVDEAEKNKSFAESVKADYPILSDPTKETATAYGILDPKRQMASRVTFYIDKEGVVRYIDRSVKTETHGADIAAKVKELGLAD